MHLCLFFRFSFQNSKKGKITLENVSKLPVDNLGISVSSEDGQGKSSFYYSINSIGGEGTCRSLLPYKDINGGAVQVVVFTIIGSHLDKS